MYYYELYSDTRSEHISSHNLIDDWKKKVFDVIKEMDPKKLKPKDGSDWFANVVEAVCQRLDCQRITLNAPMFDIQEAKEDIENPYLGNES